MAVLEPVLEELVSDVTCRQQVFAGFYHTSSSLGLFLFTLFPNQVQLLIQDLRAVSSSQVPPPYFTVTLPNRSLLTSSTGLCRRFGKPRALVTVPLLYCKELVPPLLLFLSPSSCRLASHGILRPQREQRKHLRCYLLARSGRHSGDPIFQGNALSDQPVLQLSQRSLQQCQNR